MRDRWWMIGLMLIAVASLDAAPPEVSIMLRWDASPTPNVLSYRLYYGEAPGPYTVVLDTGLAISAVVGGLKPGQLYAFAATAVNAAGESAFSNAVTSRAHR